MKKQSVEERFYAKVNKLGRLMPHMKTRCHEWLAGVTGGKNGGYGHFAVGDGTTERAHRMAWFLAGKPLPAGKHVLHHCDNRRCVRLNHLYAGTQKENVRDRETRGRGNHPTGARNGAATHPGTRRGERNGRAKLTAVIVQQAREATAAGTIVVPALAKQLGVSAVVLYDAIRGKTWPAALGPIQPRLSYRTGDAHHMRRAEFKPVGEKNVRAVLTEKLVLQIRAEFDPDCMEYADLAVKYKVSASTIGNVVRRETWAHV